jgi:hypothetical protein
VLTDRTFSFFFFSTLVDVIPRFRLRSRLHQRLAQLLPRSPAVWLTVVASPKGESLIEASLLDGTQEAGRFDTASTVSDGVTAITVASQCDAASSDSSPQLLGGGAGSWRSEVAVDRCAAVWRVRFWMSARQSPQAALRVFYRAVRALPYVLEFYLDALQLPLGNEELGRIVTLAQEKELRLRTDTDALFL